MGSWIYRKPEPSHERGLCIQCLKNLQKKVRYGYQALCSSCDRKRFDCKKQEKRKYRKFVKEVCERCGFIPEHACQLDVHHIDGNHHNNDPGNLKTLCANCHRLIHAKEDPAEKLIPAGFLFDYLVLSVGVVYRLVGELVSWGQQPEQPEESKPPEPEGQ